jgi:hypothetical protein
MRRIAIGSSLLALALALACASEPGFAQGAPPSGPPPPPPSAPPPPSDASASAPPVGAVPSGDWVYTDQYGWVFMPSADQYTWIPPGAVGEPLEFVYLPDAGWDWVGAPWIWGVGPAPHFGRRGPNAFGWYRHGWWRTPSRWHYVHAPRPGREREARAPRHAREGGRGGGVEGGEHGARGPRGERGGGERGGGGPRGGGEGGGIRAPGAGRDDGRR